MAVKRKLIEVSLPLEAINRESAREKSIRHGHPSTLHLWWARRPLAAARAVLFAQLVDDPSSDDSLTEEQQRIERARLHKMIEDLVMWENTRDEKLLKAARHEILKSTNGNPPPILDPFAGGGTIPLEAQRLGLEAHASDLNPVAVLINKALIEIPPKFKDQPPVFPGLADTKSSWKGAEGLAADVAAYAQVVRESAFARTRDLYPCATHPDGTELTVIAWIWARTVLCPNPACQARMPLVNSWWLSKKASNLAYIVAEVDHELTPPAIRFRISGDQEGSHRADVGTVDGRSGGTCIACGANAPVDYLRHEATSGRMTQTLIAMVAEGKRKRIYLPPDKTHELAAHRQLNEAPEIVGDMPNTPRWFSPPAYGITHFSDLFTTRQMQTLGLFLEEIERIHDVVLRDAARTRDNGSEYARAIETYHALWLGRILNRSTSFNIWNNQGEKIEQLFARNAIPMMWDFPEANLFSSSSGNALGQLKYLTTALAALPGSAPATAAQADAQSRTYDGAVLATDPPYLDNIGYSDLSDFFYVWLRHSARRAYPDLVSTLLVPKGSELVANPTRHASKRESAEFFQRGLSLVFSRARSSANEEFPATVWYAFKQADTKSSGRVSTGWETFLEAVVSTGWAVTSTWPIRSERTGRLGSNGTNSLATAIVLSLRCREPNAPAIDRRGFIKALQAELPEALRRLQEGAVAPVDLPQAAIGPGMAVFSRYSGVIEPDGSKMTVRSALARINEILDEVLNEQEGDLDPTSRFAIAWFKQHGYQSGPYGDADSLARARNTSVDVMDRDEILTSRAGKVQLLRPADLPASYDVTVDSHTSNWEAAHHIIRILESEGINQAGVFLRQAKARADAAVDPDQVKELGHLLYRVCEAQGWTKEAISFNTLVTSWPDIVAAARDHSLQSGPAQSVFDFTDEEN